MASLTSSSKGRGPGDSPKPKLLGLCGGPVDFWGIPAWKELLEVLPYEYALGKEGEAGKRE